MKTEIIFRPIVASPLIVLFSVLLLLALPLLLFAENNPAFEPLFELPPRIDHGLSASTKFELSEPHDWSLLVTDWTGRAFNGASPRYAKARELSYLALIVPLFACLAIFIAQVMTSSSSVHSLFAQAVRFWSVIKFWNLAIFLPMLMQWMKILIHGIRTTLIIKKNIAGIIVTLLKRIFQ